MIEPFLKAIQGVFTGRIRRLALIVFLGVLAVFAYSPILINIYLPARGDWDHAFFVNAVSFVSLRDFHQFPFWNPFYCGGFSYIGSPENTALSLQTFLSLLTQNVIVATKINVVLHALIGLAGMWALCRHLGFQFFPTLATAGIFVFNGCMSAHIGEGPLDRFSIFFLPWIVLFFLKAHEKRYYVIFTGAALACMFYDRGGYTFIFSVLFLVVYAIVNSILQRKGTSLICLGWTFLFWFGLSAPLLFPLSVTMHAYPRATTPGQALEVWRLLNSYIFRNPHPFSAVPRPFSYWGWWELNAYVGMVPVVLFLGGMTLRKYLAWSLCAVLFFVIAIGNFSPWSPWSMLHHLPVFQTMQVPQRSNFVLLFILAILVGAFLNRILEKAKGHRVLILVVAVLSSLILADLVGYTRDIFQQVSRPRPYHGVSFLKEKLFEQMNMSHKEAVSLGAWSRMYDTLLQNKGLINGYCRVPFKRNAKAAGDKGYRGEFYLEHNRGNVQLTRWSPNEMVYTYHLDQPDRLVINQNFDRDWRVSGKGKSESFEGVLSVSLPAGEGSVIFSYFPPLFFFGLLVFCVTVTLILFYGYRNIFSLNLKMKGEGDV